MGLGQSHLSQKIPATTTRCVYLDHLLSACVNSGKFTITPRAQQGIRSRNVAVFQAQPHLAIEEAQLGDGLGLLLRSEGTVTGVMSFHVENGLNVAVD